MSDESLADDATATPTAVESSIVNTILDLDEFLSGDVRRARKSARICVRPELEARLDELDIELDSLTDSNGNPLDSDDDALAEGGRTALVVAQERRGVQQQYAAAMRRIEVEAMPEDEWRAWYAANEKGLEAQDPEVFNELIVRCAVAPTISAEQIKRLRAQAGHPQINELANAAWAVNTKSGVDVPKSPLSSHVLRQRRRARS